MQKHARDRWLVNLLLLLGASLLIGLLWFDIPSRQPDRLSLKPLLPENVNQIRLHRAGRETLDFRLQNDRWAMLAPFRVNADPALIRNLLSVRELAVHNELQTGKVSLAELGLDQPETRLILNDTSIAFGKSQPVGNLRYLLIGNRIILADDTMQELLNTSSISFIDRHIIPLQAGIKSISIEGEPVSSEKAGIFNQWKALKANWISHYQPNEETGITVDILLDGSGTAIRYIAVKREIDLVLINETSGLEYHLAHPAAATLGLEFEETQEAETGFDTKR